MKRVIFAIMVCYGLIASSAYADPIEVIYGCVDKNGKIKKVVLDPSKCKKNQTVVQWYSTDSPLLPGPRGLQGPPGPQGEEGPQGPQGPPGGGGLGVYNGDGTFLGYFGGMSPDLSPDGTIVSGSKHIVEVLDPNIQRFFQVSVSQPTPEARESLYVQYVLYDQPDCGGEPYIERGDGTLEPNRGSHFWGVMKFKYEETYYIINTETHPVKRVYDMQSRYSIEGCRRSFSVPDNATPCYPAEQIPTPWWATTTLEHPIEIRPIE